MPGKPAGRRVIEESSGFGSWGGLAAGRIGGSHLASIGV
jgi:hypothetical protein